MAPRLLPDIRNEMRNAGVVVGKKQNTAAERTPSIIRPNDPLITQIKKMHDLVFYSLLV